jgi:hypothetical protein
MKPGDVTPKQSRVRFRAGRVSGVVVGGGI